MTMISTAPSGLAAPRLPDAKLMALARDIEANFLAEMLKASGLGDARSALGGGAGEEQFTSFLVQEYAGAIADAGGIGLSEAIYRALVKAEGPA